MTLSIVVPVHNSAEILPELCRQIEQSVRPLAVEYELIMVDDGSQDMSWEVLSRLSGQAGGRIRAVQLTRNYGQHNALLCGIRLARFPVVLTLDDDLQHPPEEIPQLLRKLEEGYDVVYGTDPQGQHGFLRNLASRITKLALQSAMGTQIARQVSAFRAFRTPLRAAFDSYRAPFVSIDVLLTWATARFASVPVRTNPRLAGRSGYSFRKLVAHALNMMTGFSVLPLQLASLVGFAFTVFGLGVLLFVVGRYFLQGDSVPGFPFIASIIAVFSGVQLFALGVIGEYLARMHYRIMDRPPYNIRHPSPDLPQTP
jgi:undecaprenyl-phosphate 4-deoxy-4-formamido-L-arabinose transferase